MNAPFVDASFYVALLNVRDVHHRAALEFSHAFGGSIVTTDYVLVEVGNWLSRSARRAGFVALVRDLHADALTRVLPATRELFTQGLELYAQRADKDWSMTDCISIVVMKQMGLTEALTADRHFEQAGFTILLQA